MHDSSLNADDEQPQAAEPLEMDLDDYKLWLVAGRPPFRWFMQQPADVRAALAAVGQEHHEQVALLHGYAVRDPEAAEAATAPADSEAADAVVAERLAGELVRAMLGRDAPKPAAAPERPQESFAGLGGRRTIGGLAVRGGRVGRRLFGQAPDGAAP